MLTVYPACFFKEDLGYSVIFPDLNYLATCGETLEDAMRMAIDCLAGYIRWCQRDGDVIPDPSPMDQIDIEAVAYELDPDTPLGEAFVNLVSVDVEAYAKEHFDKSVRKTLTIPAWLNTAALEMGINFSQVLQEALLAKVQSQ
ncbi:MAG: type II toxin-antitoxin system HicB family antitoxin [Lachnospiraceae bacterium]|nr:type II toxin-antitoxin system HicB family antitoxin [Lachnospiraceae bacterium]